MTTSPDLARRARLAACLLAWIPALPTIAGEPRGLGMEELYRIDQLPALRSSVHVGSVSSHDRSGGNNDGFSGQYSFVRKEEGALVIADLEGPGIIYRIWTPTPSDDPIEFYFDGESEPRIRVPFRDLFTGNTEPFVRPLVGFGAGGFYCYVPIPYRKSCKVVVRAERFRFYQINYARYGETAPIRTYRRSLSEEERRHRESARHVFQSEGASLHRFAEPDASQKSSTWEREQRHSIPPGGKATILSSSEPGRLVALRCRPAGVFAGKDRAVTLRAFWDGDERPAIECPAGDFFGYAFGKPATRSILVGTSDAEDYCWLPMPWARSARVELVNERTGGAPLDVTVVASVSRRPLGPNDGRFYAVWRRENPTTKGRPFTFLETTGRGHVVGCVQQSQGLETGNTYYFEGDDQTTIDGELVIHGTGSEDFYNGGWYDVPGRWEARRSFPLSGCLTYQKHLGRTGGYRFLLGDAYAYRESILQTIEHAPTGNSLLNDYVGVTYLYSRGRPSCGIALPPLRERAVVDPTRMVFTPGWSVPVRAFSFGNATLEKRTEKVGGRDVRYLSLEPRSERDVFGNHFVCLDCELPAAGDHRISIEAIPGPKQGRVRLFVDEGAVGEEIDLWAEERAVGPVTPMATLRLEEGVNTLHFQIVGKNASSGGLGFDLVRILIERVEKS